VASWVLELEAEDTKRSSSISLQSVSAADVSVQALESEWSPFSSLRFSCASGVNRKIESEGGYACRRRPVLSG
jgi:hypothetical protein